MAAAPIEDGALVIEDGRILALGIFDQVAAAHLGAAVVDFGESVVLPPMVNAHTHLELTHFSHWVRVFDDEPKHWAFVEWILHVIRTKRTSDPKFFLPSLQSGIQRCIASGTGAIADILSYFPGRIAFKDCPLKGWLFYETLGRDPAWARNLLKTIAGFIDEKKIGALKGGVAPHSPYSLSEEYLEQVLDFARRRKILSSLHLAESPDETEFIRASKGPIAEELYPFVGWSDLVPRPSGKTPTRYVEDIKGLASWNLLVHGVQMDEDDIQRIASSGATVVLCPRSNQRLGVGKAPVDLYRNQGVPLALGTDSLASNDSLSIWDEIAFALDWFEGKLSAGELLAMATRQGAKALGLEGEMGALCPGWGGSFQVIKPGAIAPGQDLEEFLCRAGRSINVRHLYIDGREVLPNKG